MSLLAKSPPEEKLLRALWNRGPLTRGAARTDAETVRRLMAVNLVEELPPPSKRAAPRLALTEAGRTAAQKLPPPRPTQLDIFRQLVLLREEVEALRSQVTAHRQEQTSAVPPALRKPPSTTARHEDAGATGPVPAVETHAIDTRAVDTRAVQPPIEGAAEGPPPISAFERRVRQALSTLDQQERLGGLIPLPRLRGALNDMGLSHAAFDDALLALEERYLVDLKVANDPSRIADPEQGIAMPDRGLLYYVVAR